MRTLVPATDEPAWSSADRRFMERALTLAALTAGKEVPVGAVVVCGGEICGEGWNRPLSDCDPSAHAEIVAIRQACAKQQNYRLPEATLYVTLEPCAMCAGAIVLARMQRVVFAARDLRFGAVRSKFRLADSDLLNHKARVEEGLMAVEAGSLLLAFFEQKRI